jgi:4,5-dihydroxyphthalate decarboxylase
MASKKLELSIICGTNERVAPLLSGEIEVEGVDLIHTKSDASETFWRQLNFEEFEIAEMSMSSYLIARDQGADMVMIPVYPTRRWFHAELMMHEDAGIKDPSDIAGKRIGVPEYQQTSSLWVRGVLEHDFGVSQYSLDWYMERTEELSHGHGTGFTPPEGIKFHRVPPEKSLAMMLTNHELDVSMGTGRARGEAWNLIDRSSTIRPSASAWAKVKPVFPDAREEAIRFFKAHGFYPANHGYVIRGDINEKYPWLAFNLYKAFLQSKEVYQKRLPRLIPSGLIFGQHYLRETQRLFGEDPYPYGVKANRDYIQTCIDFSHEQGFIKTKPKPEELYAAAVRDF